MSAPATSFEIAVNAYDIADKRGIEKTACALVAIAAALFAIAKAIREKGKDG